MNELYKKVINILKDHGFGLLRQGKGSHEIWSKPNGVSPVTVPTSLKSRHTANEVLKQARITQKI